MSDDILLRFGADTAGAEAGAKRVKGEVNALEREFGQFQNRLESLAQRLLILFSIHQIVNFAENMADAAERMDQLAQITSLSTHELRQWDAIARANGKTIEEVAGSVGKLERAFVQARAGGKEQQAAFRSLGIEVTQVASAQDAMLQVADKFKDMEDGPRKYAAAVALMGRNGKEMIPILNMGADALREQQKEAYRLGAVFGQTAEEQSRFEAKGLAMDESFDRMHLATQGLANVMMDALAPAIVEIVNSLADLAAKFVDSYRKGGDAKTVLDFLGVSAHIAAGVIGVAASIIYAAFMDVAAAIGFVAGEFVVIFDWLKGSVHEVARSFQGLGEVIKAVLTGHGDQVDEIMERTRHWTNQIRENKNELVAAGQAFNNSLAWDRLKKGSDAVVGAFSFALKLPNPNPGTAGARPAGGFDTTGGDDSAKIAEAQKAADERERILQRELQDYLQELNDEQQAARDNFAEVMRLEEEKLAAIGAVNGRESAQYKHELANKARLQRSHDDEMVRLAQRAADARAAIERISAETTMRASELEMERMRADIDQKAALGLITERQKIAQQAALDARLFDLRLEHEEAMYQIDLLALQEKLALLSPELQATSDLYDQIERLTAQHNANMAILAQQKSNAAADASRADANAVLGPWMEATQQISNGLAQMLTGWAAGMQSAGQAWQQFGQMILGLITQWVAKKIQIVLSGQAAETAATVTGVSVRTTAEAAGATASVGISAGAALARIAHNAAVAASGAYAALAAIPVVGPFIAPAVAAAALAAVLALGSKIFSAEGGFDKIPYDGAIIEGHKDEMMLPAHIANPLRSAISSGQLGGGQDGGAALGRGGDFHWHGDIKSMDAKSFKEFARNHRSTFFEMITEAIRGGAAIQGGRPS